MISHDSGLLVHELCDINPTHIHVTIPTNYRISRAGGDCCVIHHSDLTEAEIIRIDAVTVTTIPRTLHDVIGTVPAYLARQAIETARSRGAITADARDTLTARLDQPLDRPVMS